MRRALWKRWDLILVLILAPAAGSFATWAALPAPDPAKALVIPSDAKEETARAIFHAAVAEGVYVVDLRGPQARVIATRPERRK